MDLLDHCFDVAFDTMVPHAAFMVDLETDDGTFTHGPGGQRLYAPSPELFDLIVWNVVLAFYVNAVWYPLYDRFFRGRRAILRSAELEELRRAVAEMEARVGAPRDAELRQRIEAMLRSGEKREALELGVGILESHGWPSERARGDIAAFAARLAPPGGRGDVVATSLAGSALPEGVSGMLQSTFISYGGPDTDFAQQLDDALREHGVTTFFFAKDAIPGRRLHRLMREGVNEHDRVILVCSQSSLVRPGVLNEITETLQREARDGGKEYLIPITLDDYVFSGWAPEDPGVAQAIKDRVVADFRGARADPAKFDDGLRRLMGALKR